MGDFHLQFMNSFVHLSKIQSFNNPQLNPLILSNPFLSSQFKLLSAMPDCNVLCNDANEASQIISYRTLPKWFGDFPGVHRPGSWNSHGHFNPGPARKTPQWYRNLAPMSLVLPCNSHWQPWSKTCSIQVVWRSCSNKSQLDNEINSFKGLDAKNDDHTMQYKCLGFHGNSKPPLQEVLAKASPKIRPTLGHRKTRVTYIAQLLHIGTGQEIDIFLDHLHGFLNQYQQVCVLGCRSHVIPKNDFILVN